MNSSMTNAAKAVGVSLAVGSAAAVVGGMMKNTSTKRKVKKTAKKAANVVTSFVDQLQNSMK